MPKQFLDRPQIRAIGQQMCCERMAKRMGMQVPIDIGQTNAIFRPTDDAAHLPRRNPSSDGIQEDGF